jgi:hypothetical protein
MSFKHVVLGIILILNARNITDGALHISFHDIDKSR